MCGIAGFIGKEKDMQKTLKKMTDRIEHRGPDAEGFFVLDDVALGQRRLSIIDIEGGKQPMFSKDGRYVVVFNGEIYNYLELKEELKEYPFQTNSDTEVLLYGYQNFFSGFRTADRPLDHGERTDVVGTGGLRRSATLDAMEKFVNATGVAGEFQFGEPGYRLTTRRLCHRDFIRLCNWNRSAAGKLISVVLHQGANRSISADFLILTGFFRQLLLRL